MNKAYELARAEIGTAEWANGNNPKVVEYFRDAGSRDVKDDETAWCAAFVGAMLKRAGMKPTGSLAARSYLEWGAKIDRKDAKEGDIVVFRRGDSKWQGHVAFLVRDDGATLLVLGGNQSNKVCDQRTNADLLLGIRRPAEIAVAHAAAANSVFQINHMASKVAADEKEKAMLKGKKTYIVAGVTILGAVASYLVGDANLADTAQLVVGAVLAATVRNGIPAK